MITTKEIIQTLRTTDPKSEYEKGRFKLLKNYINALKSMNRRNALKYCIEQFPSNESENFQKGYVDSYLEL